IKRYGDGFYEDLARARVSELKQAEAASQAAETAKKRADEEVRAKAEADRQRLAMLQQQQEEEKKRLEAAFLTRSGRVFRDCSVCPEMVVIPAGEFMMGSTEDRFEKPPHKVTIARPFAVGKFTVTFAEWDACVAEGGCKHRPADEGWGRDKRPA